MTNTYRVMFSLLFPREGYMDVIAASPDEAAEVVRKMMADNYERLVVGQVSLITTPEPQVDVPKEMIN